MNRRGFLGAMLAACAAPAIVRAESIMRIAAPEIIVPDTTIILQQYAALYAEVGRVECFRFIVSPYAILYPEIATPKEKAHMRRIQYPGSAHFVSANSYGRRR